MCQTITNLFYKSTVQSVLCYCLICWGGSLSVKNRVLLDRVVRSASKTIGTALPTVDELYETYMMKKTMDILKDTSHPLHEFYYVAQSGYRYISERTRTNRYRNTLRPTSIKLLNAKSGRGKLSGRMGDTMGRTTFLQLCTVTTNVVVVCCYVNIYHKKYFLFGGLL